MKKQILSLLLAMLLILSSLLSMSACGESSKTSKYPHTIIVTNVGDITNAQIAKFVGEIIVLSSEISPYEADRYLYVKPISNTGDLMPIKLFYDTSKISDSDFSTGKIIEFTYGTYTNKDEYGNKIDVKHVAKTITVIDDSATTTAWFETFDHNNVFRENEDYNNNYGLVLHVERITGSVNGYLIYVKSGMRVKILWVEDNYTVLDSTVEELIKNQSTGYKIDVSVACTRITDSEDIILAHSIKYSEFNN